MTTNPQMPAKCVDGILPEVIDISEKDFWSSLSTDGADRFPAIELLRQAIAAGLAGHPAEAYMTLAAYHRQALGDVWQTQQKSDSEAMSNGKIDMDAVNNILLNRIKGWHATVVDFGPDIDWCTRRFGTSGLFGFHYMSWVTPLIRYLTATADTAAAGWFLKNVPEIYRSRFKLCDRDIVTFNWNPIYYELGAWTKIKVFPAIYLAILNHRQETPEFCEAMLKLMLGCSRSLHALQKDFRPGNWQMAGCGALITSASLFPEFAGARERMRTATHFFTLHMKNGFFDDGCHCERCWGYMFMSLDAFIESYKITRRIGGFDRDSDDFFLGRIRKSFEWANQVAGPGYFVVPIGDTGHGCYDPSIKDRVTSLFPDDPEGTSGVDRSQSCFLGNSGFCVMRNGKDFQDMYLHLTFGPHGGGHSHPDTFSLGLHTQGLPFLVETGRFGSYDYPLDPWFRLPESHNLMTIETRGFDHTKKEAVNPVWFSNAAVDFFTAHHTASSNPIRRTVLFVKDPGYVIVMDSALPGGTPNPIFSVAQNWHSPFEPKRQDSASVVLESDDKGVLVKWAHGNFLRRINTEVDYTQEENSVASGDRSVFAQRYALRARSWMNIGYDGAVGFITLLFPYAGDRPDVSIESVDLTGGQDFRAEGIAITHPAGKDSLILNPERLDGVSHEGQPADYYAKAILANGREVVIVQ